MEEITPEQLAARLAAAQPEQIVLLDVREPWELEICVLPGVVAIPMQQIPSRLSELAVDVETICICHHGGRSLQVAHYLSRQGIEKVVNLDGGMDAWARTVESGMALY